MCNEGRAKMSSSAVLFLAAVAAAACMVATASPARKTKDPPPLYTNVWAVEVEGGDLAADALATKYGFVNKGQIGRLENIYEFELPASDYHTHGNVKSSTVPYQQMTSILQQDITVKFAEQQKLRNMVKRGNLEPNDPLWLQQWFLLNTEFALAQDSNGDLDLNVVPAWIQGVTGCNIIVGIVDDGVEYTHPDLTNQYLQNLDLNAITNNGNAFPGETDGERDSHGTSCAGIVAMEKNNSVCGVGVAYGSRITGIRLITDGQTDAAEARALSHLDNVIDLYSNSWGPGDLGFIVNGPDTLAQRTFEQEAREGRNGNGSIYVWAAGNGGDNGDSCAADGYVQSIYTIAIGSVGSDGRPAFYDERCSAKLASTFVTNPFSTLRVATTTSFRRCTTEFDGTSAATPVASGTIALTLEANPDLSWRDVQYLIVYTSNIDILTLDDVETNGAGLRFSHSAGFGAIDAEAMVTRARHWIKVPEQQKSIVPFSGNIRVSSLNSRSVNFNGNIRYLEHVVVQLSTTFEGVDADYFLNNYVYSYLYSDYSNNEYTYSDQIMPNRGDIQITLTSPSGTTSTILPYRNRDSWPGDYENWPFMSVHFWGEDPSGEWTLTIINRGNSGVVLVSGVEFTFYGTRDIPPAIQQIPASCDAACARGCAAQGPEFCDSCSQLRDAATLQCVDSCAEGLVEMNGYCYNATQPEPQCIEDVIDIVIEDAAIAANFGIIGLLLTFLSAVIVPTIVG